MAAKKRISKATRKQQKITQDCMQVEEALIWLTKSYPRTAPILVAWNRDIKPLIGKALFSGDKVK
jgi:hypothetical protein